MSSPAFDQQRVLSMFLSFWVARGLMAAVEMDVFELLEGEGLSLEDARARLGLEDRPARALLDTCVAAGLLERSGGRYRNAPDASRFLFSGSEYSVRNYVRDERWCWSAWGQLEDALRINKQALPPDEHGYHAFPEDFFLDFLHGHSLAMGELLAERIDLGGARRIMDLGGGSGAVSIALCRANRSLTAVVVDQQTVLAKTAEHVARADLADRIALHAGDLFDDPLPRGCDAAVIANVLHDFSESRARRILARAADSLPAGARLIVMEMAPNDDRSGPPITVAFALTMLVNTESGDAYTVPQYTEWIAEAGFDVSRVSALGTEIVTTAIEAVRR